MFFTGGNEKGCREGMLGPAGTLGLLSSVPFRGTHLTHSETQSSNYCSEETNQ